MEGSLKELAGYRLVRAREMLSASESNLEIGQYKILDRVLAVIIKDSSLCREKLDYDDFYLAGKVEAEEQLKNAKFLGQKIEKYVNLVNE